MVTITKGQKVADYPQFIVLSPSGEYNEEDLIVCAEDDLPGKATCMFQAQLVAFGNVVYSSNDPITETQKAEIAAEQARVAKENPPDQGSIIEAEPAEQENPDTDAPTTVSQEETATSRDALALPSEESIPGLDVIAEETPATQNMSTTTPATTTAAIPPAEIPSPAEFGSPDAPSTNQ